MTNQYKQNGFAPIVIILSLIVGIGIISGTIYFVKNKGAQNEKAQEKILGAKEEAKKEKDFQINNFLVGTIEDLTIGEKVIIKGAENQDGSVTAETIYIGMAKMDFREGEKSLEMTDKPSLPKGINPEEFKNLSQEEKMERTKKFGADVSGNFRTNNGKITGDAAFVRGEILDKDETSIVIKLVDSGSKLVFYSDNTEIKIQK